MRSFRFVALLVAVAGCSFDLAVPEPQRGGVTGTVMRSGGGPLEGLEVKLISSSGSRSLQTTDSAGVFTFSDFAPGGYFIEIRRDGFEPFLLPG